MTKEKKTFNKEFKLASAYLESWGRWAAAGDVAHNIGLNGSTLDYGLAKHSGGDECGALVDRVLAALGEDFKRLAILQYQLQIKNEDARTKLGWSATTHEKNVACLKMAIKTAIIMTRP